MVPELLLDFPEVLLEVLDLSRWKSWSCFWILGILVEPPTRTMSSIEALSILASLRAFSTGSRVFLNRSEQSSSNLALVMEV